MTERFFQYGVLGVRLDIIASEMINVNTVLSITIL